MSGSGSFAHKLSFAPRIVNFPAAGHKAEIMAGDVEYSDFF